MTMRQRTALLAAVAAAFLASPLPAFAQTDQTNVKGATMAKSAMLTVPGAQIYYEVEGKGPTLLIIPGGPQDAGVFAELTQLLADRYTVVAYDPRGNSRTTTERELGDLDLDMQADDAAALIRAVGAPAFVFGTSGGAQIGFALAARHPELVTTLVAHEPPSIMLLDDPAPALVNDQALYDTYKRDGVEAAMGQFFAENGLADETPPADGPPEFEMPLEAAETFARVSSNFEYWLAHGMLPLSTYRPDIDTLRAGQPRIVVAIGEKSAGQPIAEMSNAAARALGVAPATFPGDHMAFGPEAEAFAEALHQAIAK
jgi:pimeloyl-ACP methyl ester carboxylesterase